MKNSHEKNKYIGSVLDENSLKILRDIADLKSVIRPTVCLPNAHKKSYLETPTSCAVAANHAIIPEITAASLGCALGAIKVNLQKGDIGEDWFKNLISEIKKGYVNYEDTRLNNFLIWLGIRKIPKNSLDPQSDEELNDILRHGARALLGDSRYGVSENDLRNVEYGGNVMDNNDRSSFIQKGVIPRSVYAFHHNLGHNSFDYSHFLEVYYVEKIKNPEKAAELGVTGGQIIIIYHTCGGSVPFYIGRYFSNRIKHSAREKLIRFIPKIIFHFASFSGMKNAGKRWDNYFRMKWHEIDTETAEGRRMMLAYKAGLNYSYAHNLLLAKKIIRSVEKISKGSGSELVWQSLHNTILPEENSGKDVIHRHGSVKVFPDKPVIITGYNNTISYLCNGLKHPLETSWHTSDHNASAVIKRMQEEKILKPHPAGYETILFKTPRYEKTVIRQVTDEASEFLADTLSDKGILSPTVTLRPVFVYKDI